MIEYNKIDTVFKRDTEGSKKLLIGQFRDETVDFLQDLAWEWTEKIDGTNIRVRWDGHKVEFGGRTDKVQIPAPLMNKLIELFGGETNAQIFEQAFGDREVILFGEGYGAKIQNGGDYTLDGKSVNFILFDVMICGNYQSRITVHAVAKMFNIGHVPVVGRGRLDEAIRFIMSHPKSKLMPYTHDMEGLVCRPVVELQDRCGHRVIVKIKWKDFKHFAEGSV